MSQIFVLIPAAGCGERFSLKTPKQYLAINGRTVLEHTVRCFQGLAEVQKICIGHQVDDPYIKRLPDIPNVIKATGGETRAHTVFALLNTIKSFARPMDWVMVHDAVRPTLSKRDLHTLINTLQLDGEAIGGLLVKPVTQTLKFSKDQKKVAYTPNRSDYYEALTPQMFRFDVLYKCLNYCLEAQIPITDESQALEQQNFQPMMVTAQDPLPKLTHQRDLPYIKWLITQNAQVEEALTCA